MQKMTPLTLKLPEHQTEPLLLSLSRFYFSVLKKKSVPVPASTESKLLMQSHLIGSITTNQITGTNLASIQRVVGLFIVECVVFIHSLKPPSPLMDSKSSWT